MKVSVLLVDGAKQIMLTPENEHEKSALKMIAPEDKIEAVSKWGGFFDKEDKLLGYEINKCQGGYYRPFPSDESLMFIIKPRKVGKWKKKNLEF